MYCLNREDIKMAIIRTAVCDVCGLSEEEETLNVGWPGWGQLSGLILDSKENPLLCPRHKAELADHLDVLCKKEDYCAMD